MDHRVDSDEANRSVCELHPSKRSSSWSRVRVGIRWLASISLVLWLLRRTAWQEVGGAFESASIAWLISSATVYLASQLASVVRWSAIVASAGMSTGRRQLMAAYFEGMFVNVCMPTTIGGDVLKVLRLGRTHDKRIIACTVVVDRASGLVALLTLLIIGVSLRFDEGRNSHLAIICVVIALAATLLLANSALRLAQVDAGCPTTLRKTPVSVFVAQFLSLVPPTWRRLVFRVPWFRVLVWAFIVQSLNVAAVVAATRAVGLDVSLTGVLIATTTVSLAAALPISVAGIGIREASLPLLLAADGIPQESSIAVGIIWSGIVVLVGLLGGPFHFLQQRPVASASPSTCDAGLPATRRAA